MSRKTLFLILTFVVLALILIHFYFSLYKEEKANNEADIPNPASVFCEKQGGQLEIRNFKSGQKGFCLFEDGSECEEWDFYYGKCKKGERFCKDFCGDGICQEIVCMAVGCSCPETKQTCPIDCKEIQKVFLYYYNPDKDKDETGNIKCSRDGLVAIERQIPVSQTPIKDTIELLLRGKDNLAKEELAQGITTEFPLDGFELKSVNLKEDGTLILEFNDPLNKTVGGACRVSILWSQIEATAKQFPQVKEVKFLPENLFQP